MLIVLLINCFCFSLLVMFQGITYYACIHIHTFHFAQHGGTSKLMEQSIRTALSRQNIFSGEMQMFLYRCSIAPSCDILTRMITTKKKVFLLEACMNLFDPWWNKCIMHVLWCAVENQTILNPLCTMQSEHQYLLNVIKPPTNFACLLFFAVLHLSSWCKLFLNSKNSWDTNAFMCTVGAKKRCCCQLVL